MLKRSGREDMTAALQLINNDGLPTRCRECTSRREGFCASLAPVELTRLHSHVVRKRLPAGETIMSQGDANTSYFHVLSGAVKLAAVLQDGAEQIVGLRFAGDFLGQRFAREIGYTAQTATDVELCKVPKTALDALADSNTRVGHLMHRQVSAELEETREWVLTLAQRDARQRVAGLLYRIVRRQSPAMGAASIELPLSRAEIGNYLGLTVETVSRQLTALKRDALITIERKTRVTITSMGSLAVAAGING